MWERFGDVKGYVEPFFGSGAVLLARPTRPGVETINDASCFVANFWRAIQHAPDEVAYWADQPVNEADLHARHLWLVTREEWRERMLTDPDHFDAKIAGWWVWGASCWIGTGWCMDVSKTADGGRWRLLPSLSSAGQGVNAGRVTKKLPRLSSARGGVNNAEVPVRQAPAIDGFGGTGVHGIQVGALAEWFEMLAARLRRVRVCCGDWSRITGPTVLRAAGGVCGVFLDPPYCHADADARMYGEYSLTVSAAAREWAIEHGEDRNLRIALCGYEGEHEMPASWDCVAWKAKGGYGNRNKAGNQNAHRERVWFSPGCLDARQGGLFEAEAGR